MVVYYTSGLGWQMCIVTLVFKKVFFKGKTWYSIIKIRNVLLMIRACRGWRNDWFLAFLF